jgi:YD repeat-containing protein
MPGAPGVYGNRWTNNLDVHLGWTSSSNTVSVYTGDGARADYVCTITQVGLCTSSTPGVYDLLATTQLHNGVACQLQWTKKSGTTYIFDAPYPDCTSNHAGYYGRLLTIFARNINFSIQLAYSWTNNDDTNPENLAQIVATHEPNNATLTLNFGQLSVTHYTELMSLVRPDGETAYYHYASNGELSDIDKPGNNPVVITNEPVPSNFLDGAPIASGNLPETYDIVHTGLMEVCGPRATISIIHHPPPNGNPTDGACVDFDYNNHLLADWYTRGVLNPTPDDGVISAPIQSNVSTQFQQWNDTMFIQAVNCGNLGDNGTNLTDQYSHSVLWCYDSAARVVETQVSNGGQWLTTSQTWDANNNLTSTTDARLYTTKMAYDANGNTLEVSLPQQQTSAGTIRPTSLYDYDSYNNVVDYCDPANNPNSANSWNPSPGPSPCANSGNTHYAQFTYNSDPNELYRCLVKTQTPGAYVTNITYGSGTCGVGLPTLAQAASSFSQVDGNPRRPKQTFVYNSNGTLSSYDAGNGAWILSYTTDGMARLISRVDPDGVTSYSCYNLDGSVFYTETAYQHQLDGGGASNCPTNSQLIAGAAPPLYAASSRYDADGDVATTLRHHNCGSTCTANNPTTSNCNSLSTPRAGTTCNFYDGLDRLVEVKQPYDGNFDLYTKPWVTRYLYDLSDSPYTFGGQQFYAHGNLFMTQELLPSGNSGSVQLNSPLRPSMVSNTTYQNIKATAYDWLDRPVAKYSLVCCGQNGEQTSIETLTWDTSPLDNNAVGLLGKDCNMLNQCQEFGYLPDGEKAQFATSGSNAEPGLTYTYDPDGHPTNILSTAYNNAQQYSYDVEGRLLTSTDPSGTAPQSPTVTSPATITHNYYPDGTLKSLDVSSSALSQSGLFQSSYRNDGRLEQKWINDGSVQGNFPKGQTQLIYTYTAAGRTKERDEKGVGAYTTTPTTWTYDLPNTGFELSHTFPGGSLTNMGYSAEGELTSLNIPGAPAGYTYTLRGEHACSSATSCSINGQGIGALMANGVAVQQPIPRVGVAWQYQFDYNMAVMTGLTGQGGCGSSCPVSSWAYDTGGRQTTSQGTIGTLGTEGNVTRSYDAENHVSSTSGPNSLSANYGWGPNGHPLTIGPSGSNETLHWDGGQMLFATGNWNGSVTVDDIKVGVEGDILPQDTGYPGLTFFDRGPGGVVMGCHNGNPGATFAGLGDVWLKGWGQFAQDSSPCYQQSGNMPTSIDWYGTSLISGNQVGGPIGKGGVLGMPRPDGVTDNLDTIQGVRTYDTTAGTWTTPDAYAGIVHAPASQKSYMWNGNNPVAYSDPTGYSDVPDFTYNYFESGPPAPPTCSDCDVQAIVKSLSPLERAFVALQVGAGITSGFLTMPQAAFGAALAYTAVANILKIEYGAPIYQLGGTFGFGPFTPGGATVVYTDTTKIPTGATLVATWHSHPLLGQTDDHTQDLMTFRSDNPGKAFSFFTSVSGNFVEQDLSASGAIGQQVNLCLACVAKPIHSEEEP